MKTNLLRIVCSALALLCLSTLAEAATVKWSIIISPAAGGSVLWATSSPSANGVLSKSGSIQFDSGALVDLTFKAQSGYELTSLHKNTDDILAWLDGNKHSQFGPVGGPHIFVAVFTAPNPTGDFALNFPNGKATTMLDVTGNYSGTTRAHFGSRNYNGDVAMDESGKLSVMGTMDGVVPKGGGPVAGSVGSLKTLNDTPNAKFKSSFTGTVDGKDTTAAGTAAGPMVIVDAGGGNIGLGGVAAGSAKVDGTPYSAKPTSGVTLLTPAQAATPRRSWKLDLKLREVINPTTFKKTVYASSILTLPNGDKTSFKEKKLTFSVKNGYSTAFSAGGRIDGVGNPILDVKTGKQQIDRKSSVKISKMRMVGTPGHWIVTDGLFSYSFLGQKGKGNPKDFTGTELTLLDNGNAGGVINNPTGPTTFTLAAARGITYLSTYHWNDGKGTTKAGLLSIQAADGTIFGPWKRVGLPGMGGVKNATWECHPNVYLPAGTYTVIDSDPTTWSQNAGSSGRGFAKVLGKP